MQEANHEAGDGGCKAKEHECCVGLVHPAAGGCLALGQVAASFALVVDESSIDQAVVEHTEGVAAADAMELDGRGDAAREAGESNERVDGPGDGAGEEGDTQRGHANDAVEHQEGADEGIVAGSCWSGAHNLTLYELDGEGEGYNAEEHLE